MKFKRINVDTVRCLISEEELWEHGLELEDFLQNGKKAEEFLREIIARAAEEVGYKVKGGNVSIQVSVLPEHVLALTFSEKPNGGIMNMLEYLKNAVESLAKSTEDGEQEESGDTLLEEKESQEEKEADVSVEDISSIPAGSKKYYQICFDSLDTFSDYCKSVLLEVPVENSLYKLEPESVYFLLLKKENMTDKQLCRLLGASLEFASGIYANDAIQAFIREHGEPVIEEQAIQRMQAL